MRYRFFSELKLTELCNECEAIMAGRLQYGSVCKRCQQKYDDALYDRALHDQTSILADVRAVFRKIQGFFNH